MRFLLDTNAVIALVGNVSATLVERVLECREGDIGLPSIVAHELFYGAYKSRRVSYNLETLRLLLADFAIVDFDREDARASGEIRGHLAVNGTPIGPYDVLIAGQAKARDLTLVTGNTGEFHRVPGLRVEDWTSKR
jgi:tRNA(fMet)-specific endonuclease VapC